MELKNIEILNINGVIFKSVNQPLKGKVKFKFLKLAKQLEPCVEVIDTTLKTLEKPDERMEVLEEMQNVDLVTFNEDELEDVELSLADLLLIEKLIKEER